MKVAIASALLFAATALAAALPEPAPAAVPADMPPPDYWQTVKYPANNKLDDWKKTCIKACKEERITEVCNRAPYKDQATRNECYSRRDSKLTPLGTGHKDYYSTCMRQICNQHWVSVSLKNTAELAQGASKAFTKSHFRAGTADTMDWGIACGRACLVFTQLYETVPGYTLKQWQFCSKAPWFAWGLQDEDCRAKRSSITSSNWMICALNICIPQWGMEDVPQIPNTPLYDQEARIMLVDGYYSRPW